MISPVKVWRSQKQIQHLLGRRGEIISWTIIRNAPTMFKTQAPYPVVLVQLGKERFVGQLVDYENVHLRIGQKVDVVIRRIYTVDPESVIPYGIKFKPVG